MGKIITSEIIAVYKRNKKQGSVVMEGFSCIITLALLLSHVGKISVKKIPVVCQMKLFSLFNHDKSIFPACKICIFSTFYIGLAT